MSEITDQIGLYGAIDHAVVIDPVRVRVVENDLTPYAHGAAGWFDRFVGYVRRKQGVPDGTNVFPDLDEALGGMGSVGEPVQWSLAVERLRAITLLVKTVPRFG